MAMKGTGIARGVSLTRKSRGCRRRIAQTRPSCHLCSSSSSTFSREKRCRQQQQHALAAIMAMAVTKRVGLRMKVVTTCTGLSGSEAGGDDEAEKDKSPTGDFAEDKAENEGNAEAEVSSSSHIDAKEDAPKQIPFISLFSRRARFIENGLLRMQDTVWPFGSGRRRRRVRRLRRQAMAKTQDADAQAAYLRALLDISPKAVLSKVDRGGFATSAEVVQVYLKALVMTNKIADYGKVGDKGAQDPSATMPQLLQRLIALSQGIKPGESTSDPLHVFVVGQSPSGGTLGRKEFKLGDILNSMLLVAFFSFLWLMGSALTRRYVTGSSQSPASGTALQSSSSSAYAPKEYNKENLPEKSVKTFKDVKGCDEAKAELEEVVEYLKNPAKFTRLGGKLPKGILLTGPPGTGKTLLARATAGEASVPFFYRAGSEFEEMFVGVGSRRVRSLFSAAKKKAPCIVFIDEIDAVGGSRKQWESHTRKTLNQLLVEMDGFEENQGIIVMAATNLPETLDPALTRPGRFDRHVSVSIPDFKGRKEILDLYLKDKPVATDVDIGIIARGTVGFSGADLYNLVNTAACTAAKDGKDTVDASTIDFSKDKIIMGTERKSMLISEESRKLTAYHESGHAIVALFTEGALPVHKATIMPRGSALGMVTQIPDKDETSVSKEQLLAKLDVCMGGRVAEEIIFGDKKVTTGARSDLQQATNLARHMVAECGMSSSVGPIFVDDYRHQSSQMQKAIDMEVVDLLKDAQKRVKKLLLAHSENLHCLAKALIDRETLTQSQIKHLLGLQSSVPEVDTTRVAAAAAGDKKKTQKEEAGSNTTPAEGSSTFGKQDANAEEATQSAL